MHEELISPEYECVLLCMCSVHMSDKSMTFLSFLVLDSVLARRVVRKMRSGTVRYNWTFSIYSDGAFQKIEEIQ